MAARLSTPPPYGYRLEVRRELEPVAAEQSVLWLLAHLRRQGWSLQKIADQMNALGIRTRTDLPWSKQTVHLLLGRVDVEDLAATG